MLRSTAAQLDAAADDRLPLVLAAGEPHDAGVMAVCEQVRDWMAARMQEGPTRGWKPCALLQDEVPRAVTNELPTRYCVALTCLRTRRFNQIVYQLAHELTHVFVDPWVEHPLVEVFACLSSLAALREFSLRWSTAASAGLRAYAPKFAVYEATVRDTARKHLTLAVEADDFASTEHAAVRAWARALQLDCEDRNAQILAAAYLLPLLEEAGLASSWTVVRLVHRAVLPPLGNSSDTRDWRATVSMAAWRSACAEVVTCDVVAAKRFIAHVQDLFDLPE